MNALNESVWESLSQNLTIPVELPEVKVLHKAQLRFISDSISPYISSIHGSQGKAMLAELSVEQRRQWTHSQIDNAAWDFYFEVHAEPSTWLVGGQRSGRFSAKASQLRIR